MRFTRNKKANKYERKKSNVERQWKLTVGPTDNYTFLEIKKAAQNSSKAFKIIKRVKNLMSLVSDTLRKFVPYTRDPEEIITAVSMLLYS